jgi:hypothetical protein
MVGFLMVCHRKTCYPDIMMIVNRKMWSQKTNPKPWLAEMGSKTGMAECPMVPPEHAASQERFLLSAGRYSDVRE